jgi:hypothetical protein
MRSETVRRGGVCRAPDALEIVGREASNKLAQGECRFLDVDGLELHAEVLARRHRIFLSHARVYAQAVRP